MDTGIEEPREIQVNKVNNPENLEKVFAVRRKVFVEEQNCLPDLEWEYEEESIHFLATVDSVPAGAARWRKTDRGYKLERFAVLKEFRRIGVGQHLVKAVIADLPEDVAYVYLHSQVSAVQFYEKFNFEKEGEQFEEAGIQHYKMLLRK